MALRLLLAAVPLLLGGGFAAADAGSAEGCTADLAIGIVLDKSGSIDDDDFSSGLDAAIKFVQDTSTLYPNTLFYASTFASRPNPLLPGLVTNAGGRVVDALRDAISAPGGGTRAEDALMDLYDTMQSTCADDSITCVGVFASDSGGERGLTREVALVDDFKSDVGAFAFFYYGDGSESSVEAAKELATPGLFFRGVNFAALDEFLPNIVGQVCPCPTDASLTLDDPACVTELPTPAPAPAPEPAPVPALEPAMEEDIPDMVPAPPADRGFTVPPVDRGGEYGSYGGYGSYGDYGA